VAPIAQQAPDDDDDEDGDFKDFVAELFVCNTVTGPVTQKLYRKAGRAGAEGVSELGKVGNSGKAVGNIHRDLMRKLMKGCTFPEPYWCLVPFLNKETGEEEMHETPVLLPHKVLLGLRKRIQTKLHCGDQLLGTLYSIMQRDGVNK